MKKFILFFLIFNFNVFAASVFDSSSADTIVKREEVRLNKIGDVTTKAITKESIKQQEEENLKLRKIEIYTEELDPNPNSFFSSYFEYDKCEVKCPSLKIKHMESNYNKEVGWFNQKLGLIECNLYYKSNFEREFEHRKILETRIFTNQKCIKKLEPRNFKLTENELSKISQSLDFADELEKNMLLKNIQLKNEYSTSQSDNSVLDVADVLDAMSTMDPSIIDIKKTYLTKHLELKPEYSLNYTLMSTKSQELHDKLKIINQEIKEAYPAAPILFEGEEYNFSNNNIIEDILDVQVVKLITWLVEISYLFSNYLLILLAILFAIFFLIESFLHNFREKGDIGKVFNSQSVIISFITVIISLSMFSNSGTEEIESSTGSIHKLDMSRPQMVIQAISRYSNEFQDKLVESTIASTINSMFSSSLFSSSTIKHLLVDIKKEKEILKSVIEIDKTCHNIFDTHDLESQYYNYFKNSSVNLKMNPFIPSDYLLKVRNNKKSIYNTNRNDGFVKNQNLYVKNPYSIDFCYKNNKLLQNTKAKIVRNETKLKSFTDLTFQKNLSEKKAIYSEQLYLNYYKYGYLALPFLSASNSLISIDEILEKKSAQYLVMLEESNKAEIMKYGLQNSVLLLGFGSALTDVMGSFTSFLVGWIPILGTALAKGSALAASIVVVDLINAFLPVVKSLFMTILGSVYLALFFLFKVLTYWSSSYIIVYTFASRGFDKSSQLALNLVLPFFKPILFIVVFFLAGIFMELISNLLNEVIESQMVFLSADDSTLMFTVSNLYYGVMKLGLVIIELIILFSILKNGPDSIINLFNLSTNDISTKIMDDVSQKIDHKIK